MPLQEQKSRNINFVPILNGSFIFSYFFIIIARAVWTSIKSNESINRCPALRELRLKMFSIFFYFFNIFI